MGTAFFRKFPSGTNMYGAAEPGHFDRRRRRKIRRQIKRLDRHEIATALDEESRPLQDDMDYQGDKD